MSLASNCSGTTRVTADICDCETKQITHQNKLYSYNDTHIILYYYIVFYYDNRNQKVKLKDLVAEHRSDTSGT